MNNKLALIIPLVLVSSAAFVLYQIKGNTVHSFPNSTNLNQNQTDKTSVSVVLQKLSVLSNRCRGCGRCVQIDPQHFEMSGGKAIVISSTNLTSSNLKLAINNCRDQAITLE